MCFPAKLSMIAHGIGVSDRIAAHNNLHFRQYSKYYIIGMCMVYKYWWIHYARNQISCLFRFSYTVVEINISEPNVPPQSDRRTLPKKIPSI